MKEDYNKTMRIKRLSNFVGCLKKFQSGNISLLLIIVHFITNFMCNESFYNSLEKGKNFFIGVKNYCSSFFGNRININKF